MEPSRKAFYRVQHEESNTLYNVDEGFEARAHYMMADCFYINKQKVEAHFGTDEELLQLSPFISVFDNYSRSTYSMKGPHIH